MNPHDHINVLQDHKDTIYTYLETQWVMEASPVISWERSIRSSGNALPIHIGLPGPTKLTSLIKFAQMSGIGASMRVLTRQAGNIFALAGQAAPDRIISELSEAMAHDPDCLIKKMHFYSFGGFTKTAKWIAAVEQGDFEMRGSAADGFELNA